MGHNPDHRRAAPFRAICGHILQDRPRVTCNHTLEDHVYHGIMLLECWRCEDWHAFSPVYAA